MSCGCMQAVGTPQHHATVLADVLTAADLRGHYSHGMNRLGMALLLVRPVVGVSVASGVGVRVWCVCV